jgi:glycosyltransferase involved in cell wall biosynthesis
VIINQGTCVEGLDWMELCREKGIPYATIAQAAHSYLFCNDDFSERLEPLIRRASSSFFVSNANREMLESFLCGPLANAELVRNPFGVARVNEIPWPDQGILRFAVVARLDIVAKGQDILLEVLAAPKWKARPVELNLYGTGYNEKGLKRRAKCLEIPVHFCGHVSEISTVWQNNHLLLLPSRSEGLPIALVEAMHCNRPAVVTDVGDSASLIDEGVTGFVAAAPTARLFDEALEKAWAKREHWQEMGKRAGECIRSSFPADPAGVFADRLEILLGAGTGNS